MAIVNPYDLLEDVDTDDTNKLLEKIAKKKVEEAAAAAKEAAKKIAELREAAEKEDAERVAEGSYFKAPIVKETTKRTIVRSGSGDAGRAQGNRGNGSGRNSGQNGNINGFSGDYDRSMGDEIDNKVKGFGNGSAGRRSGGFGNGNFGGGYEQKHSRHVDTQIDNGNGSGDNERPRRFQSEKRKDKADVVNADDKSNVENVVTGEPVDTAKSEGNTINSEEEVKKEESQEFEANKAKEVKKDESQEFEANKAKEEEEKLMTLNEYEKIVEEKRKRLLAMKTYEERKIDRSKEFESMQQLSLKKGNDEVFIKLALDRAGEKGRGRKIVQGTKHGADKNAEKQSDNGEKKDKKVKKVVTVDDIFTVKRERYISNTRSRRQEGYEGQRNSPAAPSNENQGRTRGNSQESNGISGGQRSSIVSRSNDNQDNGRGDSQNLRGGQRSSWTGPSMNNQARDRDDGPQYKGGRRAQAISPTPSLENPTDFPPLKTA